MGSNWSLNHHIPMERCQFLLLMLRQPQTGSYWVAIRVVWVVLQQGIWNPTTWGGIHLLQAGESLVKMETATVNWMYKLQPSAYVGGFCYHWILMLNGHVCMNCCKNCLLMWALWTFCTDIYTPTYFYGFIDNIFRFGNQLTPLTQKVGGLTPLIYIFS